MASFEIKPRAPVGEVKAAMDACVGENRWSGRHQKSRWLNTLAARNNFFKHALAEMNLSISQYRSFDKVMKRSYTMKLEDEFKRNFFAFSRTERWMAEAVGENDEWLQVIGVSQWMTEFGLLAVKEDLAATASSVLDQLNGTEASSLSHLSQWSVDHSLPMPDGKSGEFVQVQSTRFDPVRDSMKGM